MTAPIPTHGVDFAAATSEQAKAEYERLAPLTADIEAIEKIQVALAVYEALAKHPHVETWAVVFEKDYYDDEGLYEGAYADHTADDRPEMCDPDEQYQYDGDHPVNRDINAALEPYFAKHANGDQRVFPDESFSARRDVGLKRFIAEFAGVKYANLWESQTEAQAIAEATPTPSKRSSSQAI